MSKLLPCFLLVLAGAQAAPPPLPAPGVPEARARAELLHLSFAESLRVVHRDFFRRNERLRFPSESLSDVFAELEERHGVRIRWISPELTAMNLDHLPQDAFEREALARLSPTQPVHEAVEPGTFRFAGRVVLENSCLKCHLQNRTSLEERTVGLAISIPLRGG
jgi:hypothetical protein